MESVPSSLREKPTTDRMESNMSTATLISTKSAEGLLSDTVSTFSLDGESAESPASGSDGGSKKKKAKKDKLAKYRGYTVDELEKKAEFARTVAARWRAISYTACFVGVVCGTILSFFWAGNMTEDGTCFFSFRSRGSLTFFLPADS